MKKTRAKTSCVSMYLEGERIYCLLSRKKCSGKCALFIDDDALTRLAKRSGFAATPVVEKPNSRFYYPSNGRFSDETGRLIYPIMYF